MIESRGSRQHFSIKLSTTVERLTVKESFFLWILDTIPNKSCYHVSNFINQSYIEVCFGDFLVFSATCWNKICLMQLQIESAKGSGQQIL